MQAVKRDAVQIESERVDFNHQLVAYGEPIPEDLIFAETGTTRRFAFPSGVPTETVS